MLPIDVPAWPAVLNPLGIIMLVHKPTQPVEELESVQPAGGSPGETEAELTGVTQGLKDE